MSIELVTVENMSGETNNIGTNNIEENMEKQDKRLKLRFDFIIDYFQKTNPNPTTELKYRNPYELLIATILSAQTTDNRINMVTPALFEKYPTVGMLAKATPDDVHKFISSVNYAHNKSNFLVNTAKMIVTRYGGQIPEDPDELQNLHGVGRKTSNVIAATLFHKPVIAVDTHVARVSERIGLTTDARNPLETEKQLMAHTPKEVMPKMSHWLILHGRYICKSRGPKCEKCGISKVCRHQGN